MKTRSPHLAAALEALLVTVLWSTSWVLVKLGLRNIPALTFAGLRYSLALACLLPFALAPSSRAALRRLPRGSWARLAILGLLLYAVTQGSVYVGLTYLPAATVSLLLSFTSVIVALAGMVWLGERPAPLQWAGVGLYLVGAGVYFYPVAIPANAVWGPIVVIVGVLANSAAALLGRAVNRDQDTEPLVVTAVSMGIGAAALLGGGLALQGLPPLSLANWAIIGWLAVVNTAIAFTLWNHTLRVLPAVESSLINNTMMIQIPILAWLFLGEPILLRGWIGLLLAGVGILLVQLRRRLPQA